MSRDERVSRVSEQEKRNKSRNQSQHIDTVREHIQRMTERYGGSFLLLGSFPNYKQKTANVCC